MVRPATEREARPQVATATGIGLVAVIAAVSGLVDEELRSTIVSVTLVVPVVIAATIGGRRAAYIVAAAAALAFGLVVPPYGSFRVELLQDVVALVAVLLVALLVSTVVARRAELLTRSNGSGRRPALGLP